MRSALIGLLLASPAAATEVNWPTPEQAPYQLDMRRDLYSTDPKRAIPTPSVGFDWKAHQGEPMICVLNALGHKICGGGIGPDIPVSEVPAPR